MEAKRKETLKINSGRFILYQFHIMELYFVLMDCFWFFFSMDLVELEVSTIIKYIQNIQLLVEVLVLIVELAKNLTTLEHLIECSIADLAKMIFGPPEEAKSVPPEDIGSGDDARLQEWMSQTFDSRKS